MVIFRRYSSRANRARRVSYPIAKVKRKVKSAIDSRCNSSTRKQPEDPDQLTNETRGAAQSFIPATASVHLNYLLYFSATRSHPSILRVIRQRRAQRPRVYIASSIK